jgi:hypothetical protein
MRTYRVEWRWYQDACAVYVDGKIVACGLTPATAADYVLRWMPS